VMEEERKNLLVAGVCLGDITLALAGVAGVLPPYAAGLDTAQLLAGCDDRDAVAAQVEQEMLAGPAAGSLPPGLMRTVLDRAINLGKFLSAIRCLEMLGERDAYVGRCLDKAVRLAREGKMEEAARALVVAANIDLPDGSPAFQYTGPELHDACTSAPEKCITRMERENAVLRALKYLLPSDRVHQVVSDLAPVERERLLASTARERDPGMSDFMTAFEQAHLDLAEAQEREQKDIVSIAEGVEERVASFAASLGKISPRDDRQRESLQRLGRIAAGLAKELVGLRDLVLDRQFRRLTSQLEQLVESREEIEKAAEALGGTGDAPASAVGAMLALIGEIVDKKVTDRVKQLEARYLSALVTLLGRRSYAYEHEHLVLVDVALRELAFKYPVSPLVCCVAKVNDRYMVVPVWESPVAEILRGGTASVEAAPSKPAGDPDEDF
jgi:hypothetical protein